MFSEKYKLKYFTTKYKHNSLKKFFDYILNYQVSLFHIIYDIFRRYKSNGFIMHIKITLIQYSAFNGQAMS